MADRNSAGGAEGVAWAVRRTELVLQAVKGRRLRPLGMPPAHFSMLMTIDHSPGLTGAESARRLGVTPQAVALLVAKLEKRGQLERRQHPMHNHVQELHLTEAGSAALREATEVVAQLEQRIAEILDETEIDALIVLLDKVTDALRE